MKIGVATLPENLPLIRKLGFDYIEVNFCTTRALDEDAFSKLCKQIDASDVKAECFYAFFPGNIRLYAPDGDLEPILQAVREYAEPGFARAARLGGKVAVIGSAGARSIPEGMTQETCQTQFAAVLHLLGELAAAVGMSIVVEPLSRDECNFIHTVKESAELARLSGSQNVGALVDFYHFAKNGECLRDLPNQSELLLHAHLARAEDRRAPRPEDVDSLYAIRDALACCVRVERITLECDFSQGIEEALSVAAPLMQIFR